MSTHEHDPQGTTTSTTSTSTASGRHPVHVGHLVAGLALLGLAAVWALVQGDVVEGDDVRWLLPLPWVLAGGVGLVAAVLAGRRHTAGHPRRQTGWVQPREAAPTPDEDLPTSSA